MEDVPGQRVPSASKSFINAALILVSRRRREARQLARAYHRLIRALHTGRTISDPGKRETRVTLGSLRDDFMELAPTYAADTDGDSDVLPVDSVPSLSDAAADQAFRDEALTTITALGPDALDKANGKLDPNDPASQVDAERQAAHDQAGADVAADVSRLVQDGARAELWDKTQRDPRAVGYIRLSRTGTPCGFCAMLISRGPSTRARRRQAAMATTRATSTTATATATPSPSSPSLTTRPTLATRSTASTRRCGPEVTKGYSGKDALNAWRRYIQHTDGIPGGCLNTNSPGGVSEYEDQHRGLHRGPVHQEQGPHGDACMELVEDDAPTTEETTSEDPPAEGEPVVEEATEEESTGGGVGERPLTPRGFRRS